MEGSLPKCEWQRLSKWATGFCQFELLLQGRSPADDPRKTPLTDALRRLVETKESLKIKPDDDNATKVAKALISEALKGKQKRGAFTEVADRVEGKLKEKVVCVGGEREEGNRPVVLRLVYAPEETRRHEISRVTSVRQTLR